jgi:hypothetical protein
MRIEGPFLMRKPSRRTFLKTGAALAGATVAADTAIAQAPAITGGSESRFPSADAPGSSDGGYNILFILTDQEQYMGYLWPIPLPGHERLRRTGTVLREPSHRGRHVHGLARGDLHRPAHAVERHVRQCRRALPEEPGCQAADHRQDSAQARLLPRLQGQVASQRRHGHGEPADHIKALFESTMDKDYGFFDYTGTGDYIEGALGGYQYDAITSAQAMQWLKAKGRPMTDAKQPWYLAVNLVNPHDIMWLNTDLPGQPVQAKDAQLSIAPAPNDTFYQQEWNNLPLQSTWQQSLDAPGRVPRTASTTRPTAT